MSQAQNYLIINIRASEEFIPSSCIVPLLCAPHTLKLHALSLPPWISPALIDIPGNPTTPKGYEECQAIK